MSIKEMLERHPNLTEDMLLALVRVEGAATRTEQDFMDSDAWAELSKAAHRVECILLQCKAMEWRPTLPQ
jgi:hypothetical protein